MLGPENLSSTRVSWQDLPSGVRDEVQGVVGASVLSATTVHSGFSPGLLARLVLSNGSEVFAQELIESLPAGNLDDPSEPISAQPCRFRARVLLADIRRWWPGFVPPQSFRYVLADGSPESERINELFAA